VAGNSAYPGYAGHPQGEEVNNVDFMIDQATARLSKLHIVKVLTVHPGNNANIPTTVDIQPMVDMVDPQGNRTAHGIIYGVPAARLHAGGNAILLDPSVGDVGMMHIADRDTSSLYANGGQQSPPGSSRRHDMADGHYHGGLYTIAPTNSINLNGGNMVHLTQGNISHTAQGNISHTAHGSITHQATEAVSISSGAGHPVNINGAAGISLGLPTSAGVAGTLWNNAGVVSVA
jgi:hypothetical protein